MTTASHSPKRTISDAIALRVMEFLSSEKLVMAIWNNQPWPMIDARGNGVAPISSHEGRSHYIPLDSLQKSQRSSCGGPTISRSHYLLFPGNRMSSSADPLVLLNEILLIGFNPSVPFTSFVPNTTSLPCPRGRWRYHNRSRHRHTLAGIFGT